MSNEEVLKMVRRDGLALGYVEKQNHEICLTKHPMSVNRLIISKQKTLRR